MKRKLAVLLSAVMTLSTASPSLVLADQAELAEAVSEVGDEVLDIPAEEDISAEVYAETEEPADPVESVAEPSDDETITVVIPAEGEKTEAVPVVEAVLSTDEKTIQVSAVGVAPEATAVTFPVWSVEKDQDDLEWVQGTKGADGVWKATVSVKKHKSLGDYQIHCYQTVGGAQSFFAKAMVSVSIPTAKAVVENLDAKKGTFSVRLTELNVPSGVTKVEFPIWGDANGQNDLVWHQAVKEGEEFIVNVDAGQHENENGLYNIHCYLTDGNGIRTCVDKTNTTLAMENGLSAVLSKDEKTIKITARGISSSASAVSFPIWSDKNGQDDLKWINAVKESTGVWSAAAAVKGHKDTGLYNIHCYQTVKGSQKLFDKTTVTVSAPAGKVSVENLDAKKGAFTVRLSDLVVPSGVTKVEFPIWGEADNQNDLVWHQAVKDGTSYVVDVNAGQHEYETGQYQIHCYVTDGNGYRTFVGKTTVTLDLEKGLTAELSSDERTIKVTARGISPSATAVSFPVWSDKNNQDDLKWITAVKEGAGIWSASVPVKGHKDTGLYHIHCYQTVKGTQKFFDKAEVTVSPLSSVLTVDAPDEETGAFTAHVKDIVAPAGVKSVQVSVWGEVDGKNDLVKHTAVKKGDEYVAVITPAEHLFETGIYNVQSIVTDQNEISETSGKTAVEVSLKEGISATVSSDQMSVQIQYIGPRAGESLKVAVWSEKDNQDDLVWYNMTQNGNGASATAKITNHKTSGSYLAHVYTSKNVYLGPTTFTIDPVANCTAKISNVDGNKGTFRVTITGLAAPSGIDRVSVPVWPNGDQSKIKWYTANRSGDSFIADVDVANHKRAFGHYDVHVYGYANNGVWNCVATTAADIEADRYMYVEQTATYTRRVWLLNAGEGTTAVNFKAWSNTNGQDDVVNYAGVKSGTNNWYADVQSKQHKNGGNYTTEAYVTDAAGSSLAGTVSYTLAKEGEAKNQKMYEKAQGFSSDTNYLILVNRGLHRVAIYQGSQNNWKEIKYWPCVVGKPSTPTPTGTFKIKGRFDWFGSDHKCWWATQIEGYYYFHTVLYYWDDAPRRILDGTMDAAASMGCIRLDEPNARWIYTTIPRGTTVHIYN